jgi:methionyl-tRNA formyltransferase
MSMLDTVILLTRSVEQPILASVLLGHNPLLSIRPAATSNDIAALAPEILRRARLVAFTTDVLVPPKVLDQLGYGAYNFHPGSPHFAGWAPAHFAIYHRATEFGATAHVMIERVDAGPIVGVELFRIPTGISVCGLEGLAYAHLARLFWHLAKALATQIEPLPELPVRWSGQKNSRGLYAAMCDIPRDISKEELDRRIAAFGGNHFNMTPTINLHGIRFSGMTKDTACDPRGSSRESVFHANYKSQDHAA